MFVAFRYVNRELIAVFLVTLTIVLVVALGGRFIGYLQDAALGKYAAESLFLLLWFRIPEFMQLALPFSLFVGLLLTFGRLYADQEAYVLASAGVGPVRFLTYSSFVVFVVFVSVAALSLKVTPDSNRDFYYLVFEERVNREFEGMTPGQFHTFDGGKRVSYTEAVSENHQQLEGVFMAEQNPDKPSVTIWAESGSQYFDEDTGSRFLLLESGSRYEGTPGEANYRIVEFETLGQRLAVRRVATEVRAPRALPTSELFNSTDVQEQAELHWRIAVPLFTLFGALMAVGLSRVKPREGRFARLTPGVMLLVMYYLGLVLNLTAIKNHIIPAAFGLWGVHLVFAVFGVWLMSQLLRPADA